MLLQKKILLNVAESNWKSILPTHASILCYLQIAKEFVNLVYSLDF